MLYYGVLPHLSLLSIVVLLGALLKGMSASSNSTELSNLALQQRCSPHPDCQVLVDGLSGIAGADGTGEVVEAPAIPAKTLMIFLDDLAAPAYIEYLVVHCGRDRQHSRGFLGAEQSQHEFRAPLIKITVYSKKLGSSLELENAAPATTFVITPSIHDSNGEIRLGMPLKCTGVVVQLEVQHPGDSLCARKDVTEVELLGRTDHSIVAGASLDESAAITAAASRRQKLNARRQSLNVVSPSALDDRVMVRPVSNADAMVRVGGERQVNSIDSSNSLGLLCLPWACFNAFSVYVFVALMVISSCLYFVRFANSKAIIRDQSPTFHGASSSQTTGPALFYIGDADELPEHNRAEHMPSFYIGDTDEPPEQNQGSSSAVCSCSEPEPDAELDPASCPGTPRTYGMPAMVSCVGTKAQVVQPSASGSPDVDNVLASSTPFLPQPPVVVQAALPSRTSAEMICRPRSMHAMFTRASRRRQSCEKQVVMMFASPFFIGRKELQQADFEVEWNVLLKAHEDAVYNLYTMIGKTRKLRPLASLMPRPLTAANLQSTIVPNNANSAPSILHLSAHGAITDSGPHLILENGKLPCTGHLYSCEDDLGTMLGLRSNLHESAGPRLVILNACHSRAAGLQFARHGIPHVICGLGDIRDTWSRLFYHKLYSCLFQGNTVMEAYKAAIVALHTDPNCPKVAAKSFCLLPEDSPHDEVLFPLDPAAANAVLAARAKRSVSAGGSDASEPEDISSSQASDTDRESYSSSKRAEISILLRSPNPLSRVTPSLPEDFLGRLLDVWSVLNLLKDRRLVVVCGGSSTGHGIGKSAVLDAVHRSLTMQMGAVCIDIRSQRHECENLTIGCKCWIVQMKEAVQKVIDRISRPEGGSLLQRCTKTRKCWHNPWLSQISAAGAAARGHDSNSTCSTCSSESFSIDAAMESLVTELQALARFTEQNVGREWWPATAANGIFAGAGGAVLIFDGCDELIQQPHFQEAIDDILSRCPGCRVLFSSQHPPAISSSWRRYKVAQHALQGLQDKDAAFLFLRRSHRPLRWEEILLNADDASKLHCCPSSPAPLGGPNREKVIDLVARHPAIAAQRGNPQALIELADKVVSSLHSLQDLSPISLVRPALPFGAPRLSIAPTQGSM